MNEHQLHDAIGDISEELIDPVAKLRQKKRYPVAKWVAAAACLCLLLSIPLTWNSFNGSKLASLNTESKAEIDISTRFNGMLDSAENSPAETVEGATVFRAKVLEVYEGSVLVEPLEGEQELLCSDRIYVSFSAWTRTPELRAGDILRIRYDGMIRESYPAQIIGTYTIEVLE